MLYVLADFLVEEIPPSRRRSGMISWVDVVRKRFQPMQDLIKKHWGNERPSDYSSELIQEVLDIAGRLMRFVLVTYDPNQSGRVTDQDTQTFLELHADEIEALEQAIYLIDLMLRRVAFAEVLKESNRLEKQSEQLQALLNDEDASKEEKLYRMERISSGVERLLEAAKDLGNGSMKEFVEARSQEIQSLMEQIREAEANGETEQVESMMEELVENVGELNEGIQEQLQQQQQGEDELMKAYEKLKEELQAQEDAQLELSKQLDEARQQEGEASQELIESWQRLAVLAEDSDTRASGIINNVGGGEGFRSGTIRQYKKQQRTIADLRDAVDARDFAASYSELTRAERMNRSAGGSTHTEVYRQRMPQEKRPEQLQQISQELPIISQNLSEMRSILEQMDTSQAESRAMRELAKQLQQQQQELNQKQKGLEQQAKRIEGALPTADGSVSEFIEQATENMGNAQEALGEGSSVQGEGYQRQGAQNLRNARERLDEQMQQYQQMQQQMRQMGGEGDGSSEQESSEQSGDDIDIPLPDEHMTPEEYRKALLEGMKGKVPEEYQTLKKRYYEELVQQ
ncbi:MAG: hypothetical protein VX278_12575 [Myxococcota bacterium]|nr:hypothetical protein [Myxococcota bacterium]